MAEHIKFYSKKELIQLLSKPNDDVIITIRLDSFTCDKNGYAGEKFHAIFLLQKNNFNIFSVKLQSCCDLHIEKQLASIQNYNYPIIWTLQDLETR